MRHLAPVFSLVSIILLAACSAPATQEGAGATAASPAQVATAGNEAPAKEGLDPNRIVCKRVAPTGSRLAKKTCTTAAEWQRMAEEARAAVDETQRLGVQGGIEQE